MSKSNILTYEALSHIYYMPSSFQRITMIYIENPKPTEVNFILLPLRKKTSHQFPCDPVQITHTSCHIKRGVMNFPTHEWSWYVSLLEMDKNASKSVFTITMGTKTMNNFKNKYILVNKIKFERKQFRGKDLSKSRKCVLIL